MRIPPISLIILLALGGLMTACGQKGDLYLPQDPAHPGTAAPNTAPGGHVHGTASPAQADKNQDRQDQKDKTEQQSPQHTEAEAVSK